MTWRAPAPHMNSGQFAASMRERVTPSLPKQSSRPQVEANVGDGEQKCNDYVQNETILFDPQPQVSQQAQDCCEPESDTMGREAREVCCPQCGCRFIPTEVVSPGRGATQAPEELRQPVQEPILPPKRVQKESPKINHPELARAEYEEEQKHEQGYDKFANCKFRDYMFAGPKEKSAPLPAPQFEELYQEYCEESDKVGYIETVGVQFQFSASQFCNMARLVEDEEKRLQLAIRMRGNIYQLQNSLDEICRLFSSKTNANRFKRSV